MSRQRVSVPHVRFYASDWLAGTAQLSAVERGVYITILALFWDSDGRLENNEHRLATACGLRLDHFRKAFSGLVEAKKIEIREGYVFNFRADLELIEARTARVIEHQKRSRLGHLSGQKRGGDSGKKPNDFNESAELNQEPRTKNILVPNGTRAPEPPVDPPVVSIEADVYRRARSLIPKRVGLVTEATQAGMSFVEIASVMDRYESGQIGDLETYLQGCLKRARAGPAPPRKSHLMTVLDTMIERVRDDERGSLEVREDGHSSVPAAGTARR